MTAKPVPTSEWIAVDWGTSHLRVWAMAGDQVLAEAASDAGMGRLAPGAFEPALMSLIAPWLPQGTDEPVPVLACGTPGGDQQDQWQAVFLLRHLAQGQGLQEAIDAPMFHTTSFPGSFYPRLVEPGVLVAEDRLGEPLLQQLRQQGHRVQPAGDWALSRLSAVARDPQTGVLRAAANPRGMQGYAVGR